MCLGVLVQRKRERDSVCGCRFLFGRKSLVEKLRVCVGGREREELGEFVLSWLGEIDTSTHSLLILALAKIPKHSLCSLCTDSRGACVIH